MYTLLYISEMNVRCTYSFKRELRTVPCFQYSILSWYHILLLVFIFLASEKITIEYENNE